MTSQLGEKKSYCNTHIDQYLKKLGQSGNEFWSVNSI